MENRIHLKISETDHQAIQDALKVLNDKLLPQLKTLDARERQALPKMGDSTEPFVEKTIDYAKSNPQFLPPYVKVDEMEVDFHAVQTLNNIIRPLRQLLSGLEDTLMLAGSEAYVAALSYYNSVKMGQKMKLPGADDVYNDLKKRFEGQGRRASGTIEG